MAFTVYAVDGSRLICKIFAIDPVVPGAGLTTELLQVGQPFPFLRLLPREKCGSHAPRSHAGFAARVPFHKLFPIYSRTKNRRISAFLRGGFRRYMSLSQRICGRLALRSLSTRFSLFLESSSAEISCRSQRTVRELVVSPFANGDIRGQLLLSVFGLTIDEFIDYCVGNLRQNSFPSVWGWNCFPSMLYFVGVSDYAVAVYAVLRGYPCAETAPWFFP